MPECKLRPVDSHDQQPRPLYPADILPLMQSLLATLADIDFVHEREVDKLNAIKTDACLKERMISRLNERHRERRVPYVQQLTALQEEIRERIGLETV